ncbi:MAG: oligoendopeptidase F [Clostridia bacterium]|nr:oligoendopeptidase F [Clostridia bacterium]
MKERSEIEEKFKWDLSKFCKDDEDFKKRLQTLSKKIPEIKKYEGKLSDDKMLFECLEMQMKLLKEFSLIQVYSHLRLSENNADRSALEMSEMINFEGQKFSVATAFIHIEMNKFSTQHLEELKKQKVFKNYVRLFDEIERVKKHTLSKSEEMLLTKIDECLGGNSDVFDRFADVDLKFDKIEDSKGKKHEFSYSKYLVYAESKDRVLRENAFKEMNGKYGDFINFISANYINNVREDCVYAKIKKYKSALSASIFNEEASEDVYNLLVKKVRENVGLLHRYFEIKRKMLKLDKFAVYDTMAPVADELNKTFTYDEAIETIKQAVAVLGEEYVSLIDRAKEERWIDVYPNKNKDSGAFSCGTFGATPVVLTNFEGTLESVFTLAHELGHAMHTYLSNKNQPIQTSDYVIFVAEVASTVNEMLLLNYLLGKAETIKEKIYYYDYFLRMMRSTIFRQTMFAEFEQFAHEEYEKEIPLTCGLLCDKYEELNSFYHGKKVKQIKEMKYEWARIPHFYSSFYVYKYATGLSCAIKISNNLLHDKNFVGKYLKFLSSGCSQDPVTLLKNADCDLTSEQMFDEVFGICESYIKNWENALL